MRYDGAHQRDSFASERLAAHLEWVPVCPEAEAGLGVPRPPMRLERAGAELRLLEIDSRRDHTTRLREFAGRRISPLIEGLSGCLCKQGSPSCGVTGVKIATTPAAKFQAQYQAGIRAALARPVTRGRHVNVLQHAAGCFKKYLVEAERTELSRSILDYAEGHSPRSAPMRHLRALIRQNDETYLASQTYFAPHPFDGWSPLA